MDDGNPEPLLREIDDERLLQAVARQCREHPLEQLAMPSSGGRFGNVLEAEGLGLALELADPACPSLLSTRTRFRYSRPGHVVAPAGDARQPALQGFGDRAHERDPPIRMAAEPGRPLREERAALHVEHRAHEARHGA